MRHHEQEILATIDKDMEQGFGLLVEYYQEPLYWHIRRLVVCHSDTEDALQEVFMRAYGGLRRFRRDASLSTWLYRIATNEAMRQLSRRGKQHTPIESRMAAEQAPYIDLNNLEAIALQKAIAALPPKQRVVFNLCYYDELDYEQVAAIVGGKASAAKANYHLAKQKVKEYLLANI